MKKIITLALMAGAIWVNAQVGVNTTSPAATLDVTGKPTIASVLDGLIPPRITGVQLRAKIYTAAQTGATVYVTAADTAPAGQTISVTSPGYYIFNGTDWNKLVTQSATSGSTVAKRPVETIAKGVDAYSSVLSIGDFEFRINSDTVNGGQMNPEIRFTGTGDRSYLTLTNLQWEPGSTPNYSTTGATDGIATSTFTAIPGNVYGSNTAKMVAVIRILDTTSNKYYRYEVTRIQNGTNFYISQICENY
ncbi:hypothetical protein [Chryseobacterium sp. IT-36CA2]|uniref:hypothetical protein n=1 Tax=Chryseobacterium sp. IT-36CA2 TaxID=3026460 RepID=UPI0039E06804